MWGNKELREKGEKDELNYLYNIEDIGVFSGKERQTYDEEKKRRQNIHTTARPGQRFHVHDAHRKQPNLPNMERKKEIETRKKKEIKKKIKALKKRKK